MRRVEMDFNTYLNMNNQLELNGKKINSREEIADRIRALVLEELNRIHFLQTHVDIKLEIEHST